MLARNLNDGSACTKHFFQKAKYLIPPIYLNYPYSFHKNNSFHRHRRITRMKLFTIYVLFPASAAAAAAADEDDDVLSIPVNDVTSHSKILLDVVEMQDLIDAGNKDEAMTIYTEGK